MAQTQLAAATEAAVPKHNPAVRSGDTVTVGCKLPNGLWLSLHDMVDTAIAGPSGFTVVPMARRREERFCLNGTALDVAKLRRQEFPGYLLVNGYALTPGIPRDFWEEWLKQNERSDLVRNHLIYAQDTHERAHAVANESTGVRSGLEPIDPAKPPRDTRGVRQYEARETSDE